MPCAPLDRWSLSRELTRLANASAAEIARRVVVERPSDVAYRIGMTGAPGAGKSTLVGQLAMQRLARGRVGVLAVDPSSPKSGGAILGDRVRMDDMAGSHELYIRSLGSRRTTDGLADNLPEMLDLMDGYGFAELLLETVGVGQAEYAVRAQVDTLVLVLLPDSGDAVQAMKAGIMEMADIFVVNKADLPGAQRMVTDLRRIAAVVRREPDAWAAPILLTAASQPDSTAALSDAIDSHRLWLEGRSERLAAVRMQRARYRLKRLVEMRLGEFIARQGADFYAQSVTGQMSSALDAVRLMLDAPTQEKSAC